MYSDNFPSEREYNDYLERIEDIVWKLSHDEDVQDVEEEIRQFKEQHLDSIEKNKRRPNEDDKWINEHLEEEAKLAAARQSDPHHDVGYCNIV